MEGKSLDSMDDARNGKRSPLEEYPSKSYSLSA